MERPTRATEYDIFFGSRDAEKGWQDLKATTKGPLADAWDFLTRTPTVESDKCYRLRADLATITRNGNTYDRWQYKLPGGARIWYYIDPPPTGKRPGRVNIERVSTAHPNETMG